MSKITDYAALSSTQSDDVLPVVDVHDTSMDPSGTTKRITVANLVPSSLPPNGTAGGALTGTYPNPGLATVTIGEGGTGQATQQAALDALAGAVTSGDFLRGNGTHVAMAAIQAADVPALNQNTTGTAANITDTLDQVPGPAANVAMNSHKLTGLANGSASTDSAAFGQLPSSGSPLALGSGGTGVSESTAAALLAALGAAALAGATLTGWLAPAVVALTDASTVTVNAALGNVFTLLTTSGIGATRAIGAPSNPVDGQVIRFRITQAASGGPYAATWNTAFDFGTGGTPSLTATASKTDVLAFEYVATNSLNKWVYLGAAVPQGF